MIKQHLKAALVSNVNVERVLSCPENTDSNVLCFFLRKCSPHLLSTVLFFGIKHVFQDSTNPCNQVLCHVTLKFFPLEAENSHPLTINGLM